MITGDCLIYQVDRGFVNPGDLTLGSQVYTLDHDRSPGCTEIVSLTSDYVSGKINSIDSGAHNVDVTDDARLLYYSENHGSVLLSWNQIPAMTPDKRFSANKYLPVLSWPEGKTQNCTVQELEYIARMVAVHAYDRDKFKAIIDRCGSLDAMILVDMLEFWCSRSPGDGWFARVSVKSRSHVIKDKYILHELAKIAVLAGYTAFIGNYEPYVYALKISYESMPIPGSRPKNEKYFKKYFSGICYNIDAGNKPILGISKNRVFYLPTSSVLNGKDD